MSKEDAKQRCAEAYASYKAMLDQKGLKPAKAELPPPNFFNQLTESVSKVYRNVVGTGPTRDQLNKMTPDEAEKCIQGAIEVVKTLSDESGDERELSDYADQLIYLTNEWTAVVERQWGTSNYAPITANIRAATDGLTKTKQRADKLANDLNIGADLLTAFGKLLGVLQSKP